MSAARGHHPTLTSSRLGHYAHCSCGWRSAGYTTVTGAHLAFGEHLRKAAP